MTSSAEFPAPIIIDPIAQHTGTVFFLHGGGENGSHYTSAVQHWQKKQRVDGVKFVLPNGSLAASSGADVWIYKQAFVLVYTQSDMQYRSKLRFTIG